MKFNRFSTLRGLTAESYRVANLLKICSISALLFSVSAFADDSFFNSPAGFSSGSQEAMVTDFYGNPVPAHSADYYNHLIANAGNEKISDLDKKVDAAKNDPKLNSLQQKVLNEGANGDEDHGSEALKYAMSKPQQSLIQPQHKILPPPPKPEVIYHTPVAKQQGNATNFSSATSGQQQDSGGLGIQY